jgi:type IV pilus assembly protein PilW
MRPIPHPSERGFSMVELMVAMLIGLIGMIIIFQVFEVSEGIKRTTTSGGDAQQNGAIALYVIEHDLRNAGMGFNDVSYAGCNVVAYDSKRATPDFTMKLVPVSITPGATAKVADQFTVLYGSGALVANPSMLSVNMDSAGNGAEPLSLTNPYAFRPGDLVVLLEPASLKNCSLMELTGFNGSNVFPHQANTGYLLLGTLTNEVARFNKPGGLGVFYAGVGTPTGNVTRVYNLGNLYEPANRPNIPVNNTYAINASNALTVTATFTGKNVGAPLTSPVADNIVHMRALYGVDDGVGDASVTIKNGGVNVAGDGLVDRFVDAATFNALPTPPWQSLIAVRVAIVARSALPERPLGSDGAKCDATTDGTESTPGPDRRPTWSGGVIDVSASGDPDATSLLYWKCYRYRVFETTVPLRNWIWKSS